MSPHNHAYLGPLDLLYEVCKVSLHWDVVFAWLQVCVEVLVVWRVLLQHQAVAQHQVREPVRSHCSIHIHLVLILTTHREQVID